MTKQCSSSSLTTTTTPPRLSVLSVSDPPSSPGRLGRSTRRSPVLKKAERSTTSFFVDDEDNDDDNNKKTSKGGGRRHRRISQRSWSEECRLWLLKSKQCILMWKRLLVIVGTLSLSTFSIWNQYHDLEEGMSLVRGMGPSSSSSSSSIPFLGRSRTLKQQKSMEYYERDRQLFQDINDFEVPFPLVVPTRGEGLSLLEQAGYVSKPLMMGMLWPTAREPDNDDYYNEDRIRYHDHHNHRHNTKEIIDDEWELQHFLVVSIDNTNDDEDNYYNVRMVTPPSSPSSSSSSSSEESKTREYYFRSLKGRRAILRPNLAKVFPPPSSSVNRDVIFDVNYTLPELEPFSTSSDNQQKMDFAVPEGCKMQYEWQSESHPTCNKLHEQDIASELLETFSSKDLLDDYRQQPYSSYRRHHDSMRARLLTAGGYRNVWMIRNGTIINGDGTGESSSHYENPIALKTLLYEREYYESLYHRHNLDALVTSRLQQSPVILNIYGHCGTSGLYEYARGGDLIKYTDKNQHKWDSKTKLRLCYNVARAIADLHTMAGPGRQPVVAHTDIFPNQFLRVDAAHHHGSPFKLNDFNRARWIHLPDGTNANVTTKEDCGFTFKSNLGPFRSPEEYAYQRETEAVDIFSMGNIFFWLLVGEMPFSEHSRHTVKRVLKDGRREHIPSLYKESRDPLVRGIVKAIRMAWIHEPTERATAQEVEQHLRRVMIDNGVRSHVSSKRK